MQPVPKLSTTLYSGQSSHSPETVTLSLSSQYGVSHELLLLLGAVYSSHNLHYPLLSTIIRSSIQVGSSHPLCNALEV